MEFIETPKAREITPQMFERDLFKLLRVISRYFKENSLSDTVVILGALTTDIFPKSGNEKFTAAEWDQEMIKSAYRDITRLTGLLAKLYEITKRYHDSEPEQILRQNTGIVFWPDED